MMVSTEQRLVKAQETEVFCLMGELNSLKRRLKRLTSTPSQAKQLQKQVCSWYSALSPCQRVQVNIAVVPDVLSLQIKTILQNIMVYDVDFLNNNSCLCWSKETPEALQILKRSSLFGEHVIHPCKLSERTFLEYTSITWSSSKPLNYTFFASNEAPITDIFSLMVSISQGECCTEVPADLDSVQNLPWLRAKSCFSLAQLFVAILELRIWRCYKKRKTLTSYLTHSASTSSSQIENVLDEIFSKCNMDVRLFQQVVQKKCTKILRELTNADDQTVPLYLSIMKRRLNKWHTYCTLPSPEANCKKLWTLHFLSTIIFILRPAHCPGRPLPRVSNSVVTARTSKKELFRNLMSVPLLDSFSLLHEVRLLLRAGLIADHHTADLLLTCITEPLDTSTIPSTKKKKVNRKKRNKRKTSIQSSPPTTHTMLDNLPSNNSSGKEKTSQDKEKLKNLASSSPFAEALAPRDVPPSLIVSTQTMVEIIPHIIEVILENVFKNVIYVIEESTGEKEEEVTESCILDDTSISSYESTLTAQVVAALLDVSPNSTAASHLNSNSNGFETDSAEKRGMAGMRTTASVEMGTGGTTDTGTGTRRMLCVSPSDSGFYDSLYSYSLPSWVHTDFSGGNEHEGTISLTFLDGGEEDTSDTGSEFGHEHEHGHGYHTNTLLFASDVQVAPHYILATKRLKCHRRYCRMSGMMIVLTRG